MDNQQATAPQIPLSQQTPPLPPKKNKTIVVVVIIVLALILLGAGGYTASMMNTKNTEASPPPLSPRPSNPPPTSINNIDTNELLAGGSSFSDPQGVFSVLYPSDYKLDTSDPKHPRVYKVGATQKGQTEMYDGVVIVFETYPMTKDLSLNTFVDEMIKHLPEDGISTLKSPKKAFVVKSYIGYTFEVSSMGDATYYFMQKDTSSKYAVLITIGVNDPQHVGYQKEVATILSTLSILK